jgi:hypothetical protein
MTNDDGNVTAITQQRNNPPKMQQIKKHWLVLEYNLMRVGQKNPFWQTINRPNPQKRFYKEQNNPHHYIQGCACTQKKEEEEQVTAWVDGFVSKSSFPKWHEMYVGERHCRVASSGAFIRKKASRPRFFLGRIFRQSCSTKAEAAFHEAMMPVLPSKPSLWSLWDFVGVL